MVSSTVQQRSGRFRVLLLYGSFSPMSRRQLRLATDHVEFVCGRSLTVGIRAANLEALSTRGWCRLRKQSCAGVIGAAMGSYSRNAASRAGDPRRSAKAREAAPVHEYANAALRIRECPRAAPVIREATRRARRVGERLPDEVATAAYPNVLCSSRRCVRAGVAPKGTRRASVSCALIRARSRSPSWQRI